MSWKHLGETFDIHGGGIDLVFPHHENEIAQSRCAFHTGVMANFWMHNGFLQVEGEKMSKSLGNFVTIRDVLKDWPGEVARFNMLRTHYRQPIDWTIKGLEEADKVLSRWSESAEGAEYAGQSSKKLLDALSDDLNTPLAIVELHRLAREAADDKGWARRELVGSLQLLGFSGRYESVAQERSKLDLSEINHIEMLIAARTAARVTKNFAESDRIRDELAAMGVVLKDTKDGTTWELAR